MRAFIDRYGVAARNQLDIDRDMLVIEDDDGNTIEVHVRDNGSLEVRCVGRLISMPLVITPIAANSLVLAVQTMNLECQSLHPEYGHCYLQRGHEGDHRAHDSHYWTWSNTHVRGT